MTKKRQASDIWLQDWFINLDTLYKLFFLYLRDNASNAGIWRPNKKDFDLKNNCRIDLYKFLDAVNKDETIISVLPNNNWFLNYHISANHGSNYKPTNNWMNADLKEAFLAGVPLEWIKGLTDKNLIDVEKIKNSYIQRTLKHALPPATTETITPTIILQSEPAINGKEVSESFPQKRKLRIPGTNPGFILPEIDYSFDGKAKDIKIEQWLQRHPFPYWIKDADIRDAAKVKCVIETFIKKLQATPKQRTVDEMGEYFNNWATIERIEECIYGSNEKDGFQSIRDNYT
jgi:hypothetical protein